KDSTKIITENDRQTIEQALSGDFIVKVMPIFPDFELSYGGIQIQLKPSITGDIRSTLIQQRGFWLNTQRKRFEIILPSSTIPEDQQVPFDLPYEIAGQGLKFTVVGTSSDSVGYMDHMLRYRLSQVLNGMANVDSASQIFEPSAKNPYIDRFLYARIHAKSLDDVIPVVQHFEGLGYQIYGSSRSDVESMKKINSMLTSFMLLINSAGGLACIAALFVLMFEAIKRKKKQIGIMRAMGLPSKFITSIFLYQATFYGAIGLLLALFSFQLLTLFLDNTVGHILLEIQGLDGNIFQISGLMIVLFLLAVVIICLIAGMLATRSIKRIDPADILADN
ncbi:MAG: FtsX-like permease family protein, partial [Bacteroidota bacterium]